MSVTIRHRAGRTLYVAETAADVRTAVVEAVKAGADLAGADLTRGAPIIGFVLPMSGEYLDALRDNDDIPRCTCARDRDGNVDACAVCEHLKEQEEDEQP